MFCGDVAGALSASVALLVHQWCLMFLLRSSMFCSSLPSDMALCKHQHAKFFCLFVCKGNVW